MSQFNPKLHHRRSIRLKKFDYSQAGLYFITLVCQDRAHLFGKVKEGQMLLNEYGRIAEEEWQKTLAVRSNCRLHESVIMPNHIHGIVEITYCQNLKNNPGEFRSPSHTIGSIIRGFKISTIKKIKDFIHERGELQFAPTELQFAPTELQFAPTELQFAPTEFDPTMIINRMNYRIWQRNYYESIIRDEKAYDNISRYILNNPKNWKGK